MFSLKVNPGTVWRRDGNEVSYREIKNSANGETVIKVGRRDEWAEGENEAPSA